MSVNTSPELIEEFKHGRMIVLMDDEERENEGDLIVAAVHVKPDTINFMARYGRGLICMPMTRKRCEQLGLKLMVGENREAHRTQFTISIDAARGVTTGISASDRAATVLAAIQPDAKPSDLVQPGHIFPLMAQSGGVLTRAGHTEAGCDLARLAGLEPAAVLVEVLNEDGSMARRPELEAFADAHGLKIGTIADLIHYRMLNEKTVERVAECQLPTHHGDFHMFAYRDRMAGAVHFALVAGSIDPREPVLIRVHVRDSLADLAGSRRDETSWSISGALERIAAEGAGAVVILRNHEPESDLIARIRGLELEAQGVDLPAVDGKDDLRTHGLGAQILLDLGVRRMRVLGTPKKLHGISGFGLEVVEYVD